MIYQIIIYTIVILFTGFYVGSIIDRSHEDAKRSVIARKSILEDLTRIAEMIEENNRLLVRVIERRKEGIKRRYEDVWE